MIFTATGSQNGHFVEVYTASGLLLNFFCYTEEMIPLLGFTLHTLGEVLVAYTAIMVHHRVWKEHKIDDVVFSEMHRERILGFVGISLIAIGYFLQVATGSFV